MKREPIPWPAPSTGRAAAAHGRALLGLLPVAVAVIALVALYARTASEMAATWAGTTTHSHAMLVPLISVWLVWRRRAVLSTLPLSPSWPWLVPLALAGVAWL